MPAVERMQRRSRVLKAMAHPARLKMLDLIAQAERCVSELQRLIGTDVSTVSKHLAVLRSVGLVDARRDGLFVRYRLREPAALRELLRCLICIESRVQRDKLRSRGSAAGTRPVFFAAVT